MALRLINIKKSFDGLTVLDGLNLEAQDNRLTCILGPSGCGKTTLLQIISGLLKPDNGSLEGFDQQKVSYIFQEPRLLKWKTVAGNLDFVLKDQFPAKERKEQIMRYLALVELTEFADYYPYQLSGGMKQRAAIARAFAYPADLLLMDEPFSGLDWGLKKTLIAAFIRLWIQDQRSVFFVTHDISEALLSADEIVVLTQRPARIKERIKIPIGQQDRDLNSEIMTDLSKSLYQLITINNA